jgi:hypothetical protein
MMNLARGLVNALCLLVYTAEMEAELCRSSAKPLWHAAEG